VIPQEFDIAREAIRLPSGSEAQYRKEHLVPQKDVALVLGLVLIRRKRRFHPVRGSEAAQKSPAESHGMLWLTNG
jgi:hypothetical protein